MIIKGTGGGFDLDSGEKVRVPASHGMMHDPEGRKYRKCTVLWGPYEKTSEKVPEDKVSRAARQYLGRTHMPRKCLIDLPPRSLKEWTRVGEVKGGVTTVYYKRTGKRAPGRKFFHPFGKRRLSFFFRKGKAPVLYAWREWYRLELPSGCILDDRGFVFP